MTFSVSPLLPIIISLLGFIFLHIYTKEFRDGLKELRIIQRELDNNNSLYKGDFFRGILSSKGKKGVINVFIDGLPAKSQKRTRICLTNALNESYLIIGESGCGKSTFLYQDYIYHPFNLFNKIFPYFHAINWLSTFSLFLSSSQIMNLDSEKINRIRENYSFMRMKHTILYLDGLDELGSQFEVKRNLIIELIHLMKNANKCEIKIACRRNFADRNNYFKDIFEEEDFASGYQVYEIDYWDSDTLEDIAMKVLTNKKLKETINNQSNEIQQKAKKWRSVFLKTLSKRKTEVFKTEPSFDKCLINSPLLLMLFLYTNLFTKDDIDISKNISKYELYEKFITAISESVNVNNNKLNEEKRILAEIAFEHFIKSKTPRINYINESKLSSVDMLRKLIKKSIDKESCEISFIHYSFLDYFVAYYYQLSIFNRELVHEICVKVLSVDYQNEIADFITDALQLNKPNDRIAENMCKFYFSLMQIRAPRKRTIDTFLAKKEIVFRLGRLFYSSKKEREQISDFLRKIYFNDEKTFEGDEDYDIHLAMLKRWIAIAGSLLNTKIGEEIELDYIKKMICNTYDNNVEDIANRSQTLVFYGDVTNVSSLDYRDIDSKTECVKSVRKRVNRLLTINEKSNIDLLKRNLNPRFYELKNYCFRAFDLASIYCLLRFHGGSNKLFVDELKRIKPRMKITDINVVFEDSNSERERIMQLLLDALTNEKLPEKINL